MSWPKGLEDIVQLQQILHKALLKAVQTRVFNEMLWHLVSANLSNEEAKKADKILSEFLRNDTQLKIIPSVKVNAIFSNSKKKKKA